MSISHQYQSMIDDIYSVNITILISKSRNYASFKVHFLFFGKDYSFVLLMGFERKDKEIFILKNK